MAWQFSGSRPAGRHERRHKKHVVDQAEAPAVGMAVPGVTPRRSNRRGCRRRLFHARPAAAGAMCWCHPDQRATAVAPSDAGGRSRESSRPVQAETAMRSLERRGRVSQAEALAVGKAFLGVSPRRLARRRCGSASVFHLVPETARDLRMAGTLRPQAGAREVGRQHETAEEKEAFPLMPVSRSDVPFDYVEHEIHGKRSK